MIKKGLLIVLLLFLAIQIVPVEKTNPEESAPINIEDMEVKMILDQSCMDCHSNNTVWPWYSSIAPMSWKISEHVVEGRKELNFSEWGTYSTKKAIHKLEEVIEEVEEGHMPEDGYVLFHPEAEVTEQELSILKIWVTIQKDKLAKSKSAEPLDDPTNQESEGN